jgi:hypothetical protein
METSTRELRAVVGREEVGQQGAVRPGVGGDKRQKPQRRRDGESMSEQPRIGRTREKKQ